MRAHEPTGGGAGSAAGGPVAAHDTLGGDPPRMAASRRTLAAALGALALLAAVAVLAGGLPDRLHGPGAGISSRALLADAAAVLLALTLGGLGLLLVDAWLARRRGHDRLRRARRRLRLPKLSVDPRALLAPLALGAVMTLILALALLAGSGGRAGTRLPLRSASPPHLASPGSAARASGGVPIDGLVFAIAAGAILLGALAFALRTRRARPAAPAHESTALVAAVEESLEDLAAEADPRRAVIKAYDRMERALASSGTPRAAAETPLEYLRRALAAVHASQASIRDLTDLFEQARFSRHAIDVAMKRDAIEALTTLRSELAAGAPA